MRARNWLCLLALVGACRESSDDAGAVPVADSTSAADVVATDPGAPPADTGPDGVAVDAEAPDAGATVADTPDTVDAVKKDTISEDSGPTGSFTWVKIGDSLDNDSIKFCDPFKSPGADIDAVELYRDGKLIGSATKVVSDIDKDPLAKGEPCENTFQDANTAIGAPDATSKGGSVSLNAGSILLQLADGEPIMPQDEIVVYEVGAELIGIPEAYSVSIGESGAVGGEWIELAKKVEGKSTVVVSY